MANKISLTLEYRARLCTYSGVYILYLTRLFLTCNVYSIDIKARIIVDITSHNLLKFHVGFNR